MTDSFAFLIITLIIILGFEAVNGWTDAPNAIATVVSTRVLSPTAAVGMAAVFNLLGALSGTAVATTIGKGIVDIHAVTLETVAAAALTITTSAHLGIPLSTTHTIGTAIMGVGATRRLSAVRWGIAYKIVAAWVLTFPICFGLGWLIAWLIPH